MRAQMTPRERRRSQRLASIKDAAFQLVVADGIGQFSIHRLAERLDLTPGALYRYYSSRDEILLAVELEVLEEFERYLDAVDEALTDWAPLHRVVAFCRAYLALEELRPERFRLIAQLVSSPDPMFGDDVAQPALSRTFELLGKLARQLSVARAGGELGEGDDLVRATLLWSSLQSMSDRKKLLRFGVTASTGEALDSVAGYRAMVDELLRALLVGWGGDPASVEAAVEATLDSALLERALDT